jgi:hypothetical protein
VRTEAGVSSAQDPYSVPQKTYEAPVLGNGQERETAEQVWALHLHREPAAAAAEGKAEGGMAAGGKAVPPPGAAAGE